MSGIQFATFIENDSNREGFIEALFFGIASDGKSRIRLYEPTIDRKVGKEVTRQNLLFDVVGNYRQYKVDMMMYRIPFLEKGMVVAVEFLGEVGKDDKINKGTTTKTKLYLTHGNDDQRNTWQSYREREFVRESFSKNQQNTSNTNLNIKCRINKLNYFLSGLGKKYQHSRSYGFIF